jgi:hypothetical protein
MTILGEQMLRNLVVSIGILTYYYTYGFARTHGYSVCLSVCLSLSLSHTDTHSII